MLEKGSKVYFKDGRKNAATTHVWRALALVCVLCALQDMQAVIYRLFVQYLWYALTVLFRMYENVAT